MPSEPTASTGTKSSGKVKQISTPRVQSITDADYPSHISQIDSTTLQPMSLHYMSLRSEPDDNPIPSALQTRLLDLFQQIQREFEVVCMEKVDLQGKIDHLNERLEREVGGSEERSLPPNDFPEYHDRNQVKLKGSAVTTPPAHKVKASQKLRAQTSRIVSSFKNQTITCSMQRQYIGHKDGVWEVSVGRSGQPIIATASADHTARVMATDSGRCLLQYIAHSGSVNSIRFHPTIDLALTASGDCSAHIWQAAVNLDIFKQKPSEDLPLDRTPTSAKGDDQDDPPTLRTPIRELLGHTGAVMAADWLPGAEQLATASWDQTANLYDAETGEIVLTLYGHDQELTHVSTHHSQRLCVTSSRDSTFRLWDFRESTNSVSVFQGHTGAVTSAVFTQEDKIVSGSDDRSVKVWDLRDIRSPLATIRSDSAANRIAVSRTGIIAIPHDNRQIRLYDLNGQRLARLPRTSRHGHRRMVCSVAWSEDSGALCNLFSCGFDRMVFSWSILPVKDV